MVSVKFHAWAMKTLNFILFSGLLCQISAELFSAIEQLESLTVNEAKVIDEYKWLIGRFEDFVDQMKQ